MRQAGYTFLELLFGLVIASVICTYAVPNMQQLAFRIQGTLTMQQLQQAINYGRSLAIRHKARVTVCANENEGILVVAPNGQQRFCRAYGLQGNQLSLRQSGFSGQELVIEANGLTNNNGHFNYKSRKFSALPQFKLYFNKALRLYLTESGGYEKT